MAGGVRRMVNVETAAITAASVALTVLSGFDIEAIKEVGFPAFIALYVLTQHTPVLKEMRDGIKGLQGSINSLAETLAMNNARLDAVEDRLEEIEQKVGSEESSE